MIGDETRLRQILSNLVGNAVKFTEAGVIQVNLSGVEPVRPEAGNISWQATPADAEAGTVKPQVRLTFEVRDTGIGISEVQQESLFSRFTQGNDPLVRRVGGTGLGLAICKSLAEMMGGAIEVSSEQGKGSTFTFTVIMALP